MSDEQIDIPALVAEVIGTFGLVFIGGMAVMQADDDGKLTLLGVALAHMLILSFMVYFGGRFSGAHYNPAVTLSFMVTKKMNQVKGVYYILAQLAGSIIAGIFLTILASDSMLDAADRDLNANGSTLGFPHLAEGYGTGTAIFLEAVLTFFLVFVIWSMAADDRAPSQIYGFAIGGTLGFAILAGGPLTGAALNPARVFGPALLTGDFANHFVYWIGPIIGALLAGLLYHNFFLRAKRVDQTDLEFTELD